MSEYIELLAFKSEIEEKDVLANAMKYCHDKLMNHRNDVIKKSLIFCPGFDMLMKTYEKNGEICIWDINSAMKASLMNMFSFKFIYWRHLKLLAVVGNQHDATSLDLFPLIFQNSSDQDEEYSTWDCLLTDEPSRRTLKELREKIQSGQMDDVIKEDIRKRDYIDDELDYETLDMEYYRKEYLYKHIEDELDIHSCLYSHFSDDIVAFNMSDAALYDQSIHIITDAAVEITKYYADLCPDRKEKANETNGDTDKKES